MNLAMNEWMNECNKRCREILGRQSDFLIQLVLEDLMNLAALKLLLSWSNHNQYTSWVYITTVYSWHLQWKHFVEEFFRFDFLFFELSCSVSDKVFQIIGVLLHHHQHVVHQRSFPVFVCYWRSEEVIQNEALLDY